MNEEFYSIGRGSLNINGKFYYGLDYQITDFMRNLDQENQYLKQQLEQRDNIINKVREYVDKFIPIDEDTILMRIRQKNYLLEILNIDKGE